MSAKTNAGTTPRRPAAAAPPAGEVTRPADPGTPFHVRQGDVLLVRADVDLHGARHVPRDGDRIVLAYGEVTGHAHAIREKRAELRVIDGHRYLDAPAPVVVEHEEHAPIRLDPGVYEVIIQREYVPSPLPEQAWRPVID